ncbi:MAG: DUF1146 domain-containing protein [Erysipelotrichales bacterium]|nr:DUF1146 domain-containing protein [Erysipelotrichales bacterium]MBQ1386422.1 DUF1146 domain-containing protein [Erysipelotrichales bacterium]MBQ2309605.1 DUF1146 domain-containing protein [Erysipelotrichales bacterium]MBQ2478426.1 DUF1146 domain-containing protein [Erysipelotrichales bacterium]MBQ4375536.1 DUF1146 domain-containing protein [Erysipelotrichales bacterium]
MIRWARVVLYLAMFSLSFWALSGLDFAKILRRGQTGKAQVLLVLLSMALGWMCAEFLAFFLNLS